jgi:hypothetical protein
MVQWADLTDLNETPAAIGSTTADLGHAIDAVAEVFHQVEAETCG